MFARIAGRYDLLNRVLSAGIDRRWRRAAVEAAGPLEGRLAVDACCGTGDLALALRAAGARVVGADFTPEMIELAGRKPLPRPLRGASPPRAERGAAGPGASARVPGLLFAVGDALRLPVASGTADVASVAFGIRNVADRGRGLAELARVVRPGGRVVVLEFTRPPGAILGRVYGLYFTRMLPLVGRLVSGDREAYSYLPRTVLEWPSPEELEREMEAVGLVHCGHRLLTRGIACLHWGEVPGRLPDAEGSGA